MKKTEEELLVEMVMREFLLERADALKAISVASKCCMAQVGVVGNQKLPTRAVQAAHSLIHNMSARMGRNGLSINNQPVMTALRGDAYVKADKTVRQFLMSLRSDDYLN